MLDQYMYKLYEDMHKILLTTAASTKIFVLMEFLSIDNCFCRFKWSTRLKDRWFKPHCSHLMFCVVHLGKALYLRFQSSWN